MSQEAEVQKVRSRAVISPCGLFRYRLSRTWRPPETVANDVCFVMLNPSTADGLTDDPTIRRCVGFAKTWGYSGIRVVNLYAYRATIPKVLERMSYPIGPENDHYLRDECLGSQIVIAAWGANAPMAREVQVLNLLRDIDVYCLEKTVLLGRPCHPLYQRADLKPQMFRPKVMA